MSVISRNKKANYEYELLEKFMAGLKLQGSEVKSIRDGKVSINGAYCHFIDGELFIKDMHVSEYKQSGNYDNHDPLRERKLLLNKRELVKLKEGIEKKGQAIIPLCLRANARGYIKLEVGLCKGKKLHDKRQSIKEKDIKRDLERNL